MGIGLGGVAQWLEQRNHNPCVEGSNPSFATIWGIIFIEMER